MSKNTTTARKIRAWTKRLKNSFSGGEHPLPSVLEEEGGLEEYEARLRQLPEGDPG